MGSSSYAHSKRSESLTNINSQEAARGQAMSVALSLNQAIFELGSIVTFEELELEKIHRLEFLHSQWMLVVQLCALACLEHLI